MAHLSFDIILLQPL